MKFTLKHAFDTDRDTFWERVFFDPEYNRRLYVEALGFRSFELLELTGEPGAVRTRKIRVEPKSEVPAMVQRLIGDSLTYTETGRYDPTSRHWTYEITTSKMAEKVRIGGTFWLEPIGSEKRVYRFCDVDLSVHVFGVGGAIESYIEKTTRASYDVAARFTNNYLRELKLTGA